MEDRPTWVSLLVFGLLLLAAPLGSARAEIHRTAQEVASVTIFPIDTRQFPHMMAYLDVRDAKGGFIRGLQPHQVRILEDERPLAVAELQEQQPGAQVVVAINPGRSFAIRDGQGVSRYDRLVKAWQNWAAGQEGAGEEAGQGSGGDDYSLLITGGPEALHLTEPKVWLTALEGYQTDLRSTDARLDVLVRAMEVASETPPRPGMGRVILFVTPPPEGDFSAGLEAVIARARQQGIRLFVWMVASPEQVSSAGANQLQELASQTGGTLFAYSGAEPIPSLEELLKPMRNVYRLAYNSRVASSGPHKATAEVRLEGFEQTAGTNVKTGTGATANNVSPPQVFEVNIQPPNPVFVEPPAEILRESRIADQGGEPQLLPKEQPLDVLVEFPDGFQRQVVTMTLFVDGSPVVIQTKPPFDRLIWDLSRYTEDGNHLLRLEAIDSLGLRSSSREVPIQIIVKYTPKSFLAMLSRGIPWIAGMAVLLSGAVLALVLLLGGRINPQKIGLAGGNRRWRGVVRRFGRRISADPVTQPVRGASPDAAPVGEAGSPENGLGDRLSEEKTVPVSRHTPGWMNRLQRAHRQIEPKAHASLVRLVDNEETTVPTPIPIASEEVTFGRDPAQAMLVLDDPSVEPRHAHLRLVDGVYRICDDGSIAGTWVNYTPVSREGVALENGDLVHIGRVGFRFLIREPARVRRPIIRREDHSS